MAEGSVCRISFCRCRRGAIRLAVREGSSDFSPVPFVVKAAVVKGDAVVGL